MVMNKVKPMHQNFFDRAVKGYTSEPEFEPEQEKLDEITQANLDIKARLALHIQQMTKKATGDIESIRLQIKEADRLRVEQEVDELLADEQRTTVMGQWA